ncbi:MAG: serine/threonine-protein phosphatase [Chitinophagaceae bacterium]|nr:MAG: serine/threonine-protein phosphatase [Chitinophagaceae bacterium]
MLCVIDGVGGYEGGEVAASLAQRQLEALSGKEGPNDLQSLQETFVRIQGAITQAKNSDPRLSQMACVLTAVVADEDASTFHYAHVGDTRLYLFRDGSLVKISSDHSFVGLLEDSGRITEREAMDHPKRNEIDRALGFAGPFNAAQYISSGSSPFLPGDGLLLCSDGLTDLVTRAEMTAILASGRSLAEQAAALIAAANEQGGKDNITVVLARHSRQRRPAKPVGTPRGSSVVIREEEAPPVLPQRVNEKRGRSAWPWIAIIVLAAIIGIWWLSRKPVDPAPAPAVVTPAGPSFAGQVALLQDSFQLANDSVYLLPDSLFIGQDSLQVAGGTGTVVGPEEGRGVWQVAPTVRHLLLSHLELRETDLRISSSNVAAIRFDSVRLVNVTVGVGTPLIFRDTVLSGSLFLSPAKRGGAHE